MLQANNVPSLNLGLLPGLGGSFTTMAAGGQIERFMQYYLQAYRRAFHHIAYFSYQQEQFCNFTNDPALLSQITLYPKDKSSHYRRYALQMVRQQAQAFQACDVLRVFHTPGGIPAVQAKRRFGTPFVTTYGYKYHRFSAIEGNRLNGFLLRFAEPLILRQATAVIVTTHELQNYVHQWISPDRVHLIPNGVDTAVFTPTPSPKSRQPKPTILFVGRLNPQKNLPMLLDALALVKTPFHLRIVGDGPLRESLENKARAAGISFQFDGTRPHNELPAIFQSSDLFVLPSLIEGHPKVLIEAMSCGLPCVVSNSEGNRTLIQHEQNGFLANTQNHSQFAQQIESLLSQPTTAAQLGAAARKHILNRYDIHTLVQEEIALLRQLGEKRRFQVRQM